MAYIQKNSPFKQTALENLRNIPGLSETKPKAETVEIGKRPKRSLKEAYDIALTKGYRKKSESFADYSKRAKADPLYGKSGSKGFKVTAAGDDVVSPYKPGTKVSTLKDKEAKEYAAKTKKRNAEASKTRNKKKPETDSNTTKVIKEGKSTKTTATEAPTTTATTKQATTTLKAPKKPRTGSDKTANRKYQKEMRAYNRKKPKTEKGTYNFAEGTGPKTSKFDKTKNAGDKPKTKVKARRRAAKGSTRATLRK
ncbi:hypothetical protein N9177_00545 [bacterium]|nr:hypothetical protein [bacterium]